MKLFRAIATIMVMSLVAIPAVAQGSSEAGKADPRVAQALDSLGLKYSVNSSNNYKVVYSMEDGSGRSHLAFVVSKTSKYRSLEIREIWSIAAILDEYPDAEVVDYMFTMNSTTKIGAWAIEVSDDGEVWVMYTVKVPADLSADELNDIIYFVAEVCDELEVELTGDDEY
ncbi:MAG TPA: hypothetical protein PLW80_04230 [Spirochaetales bacterium]|nr:hypothetical protein [Spirochaetales bacterium]HPB65744.1 hypothetical protein [Spirochaetales bacterium]HPG87176.1 hypothetical protein [Spirochaetales bacterium]HPM71643.1 hypothetical protein [Spirochaetales bacterium]HQO65878.1 hypothetical protein [Spirochaetales bacterium]